MKKKYLLLISAVLIMSILLTACAGNEDNADVDKGNIKETEEKKDLDKVTLVLDWTPNTNHTGMFVADEKGFFKDNGIEVEIVQPPEDGAEALVASGKADFGVSFQDTIAPAFASDNPLPVTSIATLLQHNTSGIISLKGNGMDSPKGMEGKKYSTWENPVEQAIVKSVVEEDGGDFEKVELIPSTVTDVKSALKTDIDAIWVYYGWDGIAVDNDNIDTDFFYFKDIDPVFDYYTPILVANNDLLEDNPDLVKKFLSALKDGYEFSIDNPDEAGEILLKHAPELDKKLVMKSQEWLSNEYKSEEETWGYIDADRWNNFYEWLFENDLIEAEIPKDFGYTNEFLEK